MDVTTWITKRSVSAFGELRKRILSKSAHVVPVVGAGASKPSGLPLWYELRKSVHETAEGIEDDIKFEELREFRDKLSEIAGVEDSWDYFDQIAEVMGPEAFQRAIVEALQVDEDNLDLSIYEALWSWAPRGMLSLNLDRLAERAFPMPDRALTVRSGFRICENVQFFGDLNPYLLKLHGDLEEPADWVMTRAQLSRLLDKDDGIYRNVMRSIFEGCSCVFVGITANDEAIGGRLKDIITDLPPGGHKHFWITTRLSVEQQQWCSTHSVSPIVLSSRDDPHGDLPHVLRALAAGQPAPEREGGPVVMQRQEPRAAIRPPKELKVVESEEEIRVELNAHAKYLLAQGGPEGASRYKVFLEEYEHAIHRAWLVSKKPGSEFLGYTIDELIGEGAFGRVYQATDSKGEAMALKIFKKEHFEDHGAMLAAFRRGIESMRYLRDSEVEGIVFYKEHSELPPMLVMERVQGSTLAELVEHVKDGMGWVVFTELAHRISSILHAAHEVEQQVLHRDVRPQNIMIKNWWPGASALAPSAQEVEDVVLLDFDLSWFKDASGYSVTMDAPFGFAPPERIDERRSEERRLASVDSFGLGMTLYYMASGSPPMPQAHARQDWGAEIEDAVKRLGPHPFLASAQGRLARIIQHATLDASARRTTFPSLHKQLRELHRVTHSGIGKDSSLGMCEELLCRCDGLEVTASSSPEGFEHLARSSFTIWCGPDRARRSSVLKLGWTDVGVHDRAKIPDWCKRKFGEARRQLERSGWEVFGSSPGRGSFELKARIDFDTLQRRFDRLAGEIETVIAELMFGS